MYGVGEWGASPVQGPDPNEKSLMQATCIFTRWARCVLVHPPPKLPQPPRGSVCGHVGTEYNGGVSLCHHRQQTWFSSLSQTQRWAAGFENYLLIMPTYLCRWDLKGMAGS
jgi:hypothetical protein